MTTDANRDEASARIDALAEAFDGVPDVSRRSIFGHPGLATGAKVFAYANAEGRLTVKLPTPRGDELLEAGAVTRAWMGPRVVKEWVVLVDDAEGADDLALAEEARAFVRALEAARTRR